MHTTLLATQTWLWTIDVVGVYLAGLNLVVLPFGFIPIANCLSDNQGMLGATLVVLLGVAFLWDYVMGTASRAILYGFGSVVLLTGASFIKAFAWGLVSKLPPPPGRPLVMSINSSVYMFGRGTGAIVGGCTHHTLSSLAAAARARTALCHRFPAHWNIVRASQCADVTGDSKFAIVLTAVNGVMASSIVAMWRHLSYPVPDKK